MCENEHAMKRFSVDVPCYVTVQIEAEDEAHARRRLADLDLTSVALRPSEDDVDRAALSADGFYALTEGVQLSPVATIKLMEGWKIEA